MKLRRNRKPWNCHRLDNGEVHVVPLNDQLEHDPVDCACGPTTEPVNREDGSIGWLVVHHSLDGREKAE